MIQISDAKSTKLYEELAKRKPPISRAVYREGVLELWRTTELFRTRRLTESELHKAETAARRGRDHQTINGVLLSRVDWHLSRGEPERAVAPLSELIQRNRETRQDTTWEETALALALALAHFRIGKNAEPARAEAERLTDAGHVSLELAELWHELGSQDRAVEIALKHHEWALADGEPYVFRYKLDKTREFLAKLGAPLPPLRQHDPSKDERFPWEDDVEKLIAKLEAENAEKDKKKPKA